MTEFKDIDDFMEDITRRVYKTHLTIYTWEDEENPELPTVQDAKQAAAEFIEEMDEVETEDLVTIQLAGPEAEVR